jgi:hypothetical protein
MGAPSVLAAHNAGVLLRGGVAPLLDQSTVQVVEQCSGRRSELCSELCAHARRRSAART